MSRELMGIPKLVKKIISIICRVHSLTSYHMPNALPLYSFLVGENKFFFNKEANASEHERQKSHCCPWFDAIVRKQKMQN